jgi:coenzyme F420-reducing hydrogenase gamma subunit
MKIDLPTERPRVAVHKFSSCDGCQLAFLNAGPLLLELSQAVEIVHFAEAGPVDEEAPVDIAFVEGSICTHAERERIKQVRENSRFLITIGACATAGGVQALRNLYADGAQEWTHALYARPEFIDSLDEVQPVANEVKVDLELWGCPVNTRQVMTAIRSLLFGAAPVPQAGKVCMECKRQQAVCVMVTEGSPCMGPVTRGGCGAICPSFGRDCYACYGPAMQPNSPALARRLEGLGLTPRAVAQRFHLITSQPKTFREEGTAWRGKS